MVLRWKRILGGHRPSHIEVQQVLGCLFNITPQRTQKQLQTFQYLATFAKSSNNCPIKKYNMEKKKLNHFKLQCAISKDQLLSKNAWQEKYSLEKAACKLKGKKSWFLNKQKVMTFSHLLHFKSFY